MHKFIDDSHLVVLACALENDELGAAIRLISRIIHSGSAIPKHRARIIAQMPEDRWTECAEDILEHFIVEDEQISHAALDETRRPSASLPPDPSPGKTPDMPIVYPTRDTTVPKFTTREIPERVSIRRAAYDLAQEIFRRANQTSNTGRAILASLLKNWPEGDVYEALVHAEKQEFIVDPRGWIVAHLQRNSTPHVCARGRKQEATPPPQRKHPRKIVTPETAGVSQATAGLIRDRNANLKLDLQNGTNQ